VEGRKRKPSGKNFGHILGQIGEGGQRGGFRDYFYSDLEKSSFYTAVSSLKPGGRGWGDERMELDPEPIKERKK